MHKLSLLKYTILLRKVCIDTLFFFFIDFVIQFYSTSVLNATYRYLATIDDRIEI